jgi:hypothetical protein
VINQDITDKFMEIASLQSQHTVVTETRGALTSQGVVRGRETECREYHASLK